MKKSLDNKKPTKVGSKRKKGKDKCKKISKHTRFVFDKRSALYKRKSKGETKTLKERLLEQLRGSRFR